MLNLLKFKRKTLHLCYPKILVKIKVFHLLVLPRHVLFHFSTLLKSSQASSAPIKKISPIEDANDPIENLNAHFKDVDVFIFI